MRGNRGLYLSFLESWLPTVYGLQKELMRLFILTNRHDLYKVLRKAPKFFVWSKRVTYSKSRPDLLRFYG